MFTGNRAVAAATCVGFDCPGEVPDVRSGYGGALFASRGVARLSGSTLSGNWSAERGAGVATGAGGRLVAENSILWGNDNPPVCCGEDPIPPVRSQIDGDADVLWSDVEGLLAPVDGELPDPADFPGSLDADPRFVDASGGGSTGAPHPDLRLSPGSPCIDAGDNGRIHPAVGRDRDGLRRRADDPATPDTGLGAAPVVDLGAHEFGSAPPACGLGFELALGLPALAALRRRRRA